MVVGFGMIELRIPAAESLKDKRSVLTKIVRRAQNTFNVSIAEIAEQDARRRARIGFALVGNDARVLAGKMEHILRFVEEMHIAEIVGSTLETVTVAESVVPGAFQEEKYGSL